MRRRGGVLAVCLLAAVSLCAFPHRAAAAPKVNREWGHDCLGSTSTSEVWYLAEGCTSGDTETWILVL